MSKLAKSFKFNDSIRIKSFEYMGHTFKVRIPLTKEMDALYKRIADIPEEVIKARLDKMTSALRETEIEGVEIKDDDVIVNGKSTKETVVSVAQMEQRVLEYIKLLVPENGDISEITYEDIEEEFPLQVQFELLEKIMETISPGYSSAKKN